MSLQVTGEGILPYFQTFLYSFRLLLFSLSEVSDPMSRIEIQERIKKLAAARKGSKFLLDLSTAVKILDEVSSSTKLFKPYLQVETINSLWKGRRPSIFSSSRRILRKALRKRIIEDGFTSFNYWKMRAWDLVKITGVISVSLILYSVYIVYSNGGSYTNFLRGLWELGVYDGVKRLFNSLFSWFKK